MEAAFCRDVEVQGLFSDALVVDENLGPLGYNLWEAVNFGPTEQALVVTGKALAVLLRHQVVTGATFAFRACIGKEALPIPSDWVHDAWIALIVAARSKLSLIPEPLVAYRQHLQNQIGAQRWSLMARLRQTLSMDRNAYYQGEIRRFEAFYRRLESLQPPTGKRAMQEVWGKLGHLRRRSQYPEHNLLRLPFIFREVFTAGYRRYSTSWQVAARDLLLPASPSQW
jgi:hypothetical protein